MKISKLSIGLLAIAAGLGLSGTASAQITNGGFELPNVTNTCCTTTPPDPLPGWTVTSGDVNVVNGTFSSAAGNLAYEGLQYLDLIGQANTGSLEQSFATIQGRTYRLDFAYSHNLFGGLGSGAGSYLVDGLSGSVTHSTGSNSDLDWQTFTNTFVASGSSATLSFTNTLSGPNAGLFLDAVSISAVPEPATWALMIGGFGMVGGAMRRRKAAVRIGYA